MNRKRRAGEEEATQNSYLKLVESKAASISTWLPKAFQIQFNHHSRSALYFSTECLDFIKPQVLKLSAEVLKGHSSLLKLPSCAQPLSTEKWG